MHDNVACEVCGRTILKGERTESFLAPGGQRHTVCELCFGRAAQHGWIREAAAGDMPTRFPRPEPRRPLLRRLLGRSSVGPDRAASQEARANGADLPPESAPEADPAAVSTEAERSDSGSLAPEDAVPPSPAPRRWRNEARSVRAVPTTAEVKVERALELFNGSEHQRTIAGLTRTLGAPWVGASPDSEAPSMVNVVVAWELSWYHFRIDLGDERDPVAMLDKGEELDQIDEALRVWNAAMDDRGRLVTGVASEP